MRKNIFLIIFLIISTILNGQTDNDKITLKKFNDKIITISYQNGYVFPTNDFVRGINNKNDIIDAFQTFTLKLTKQTTGSKFWEQNYKYPEYGVGMSILDFYNPEEIGIPIAFFGYFSAPFINHSRFKFSYEAGLGFAFNWKNYSPSNVYNNAIGAKQTAYIDLGLKTAFRLTSSLYLDMGFSLSHFSNGRLKAPNLGLNTIAPKFSLHYQINPKKTEYIEQENPNFKTKNEIYLSAFTGLKNIIYDSLNVNLSEKYEGETFSVYGILALFNRQISNKSKIGIGFDISYDGSHQTQTAIDEGKTEVENGLFVDNIHISVFPSYELIVNKVSIIIQPGFYLYRKNIKNQSPVFYQRIGLKYNFYNDFYVGLNLRTYQYHISDFIEWNIGYRID
ncbi:MAG: acyloxyacyl hydrolase [Saprospiraceae bacterium]|nr:acyloxyacyl hydrolase [Saprospiraceae bacterium]